MSFLPQIAQYLMNRFPQKMMLSSLEISMLQRLEQQHLPFQLLCTWIDEAIKGNEYKKIEYLLKHIEGRAQKWHQQHVGQHYQNEFQKETEILSAIKSIQLQVKRSAQEQNEKKWQIFYDWLIDQIDGLVKVCQNQEQISWVEVLKELDDQACLYAFDVLGEEGMNFILQEVDLLSKNDRSVRPQDLLLVKRHLSWKLLKEKINMPNLFLDLHGGW
jgi:hypothetical protein